MKKLSLLLALACISFCLCCCAEDIVDDEGSLSFNGKKYICTFSDEFESEKLDNHNWYYCPQQQRQDAGGWWSNSCSTFEDGNYVITCTTKEDGTPISGGIRSRGKFEQTYGLYNIRFKVEKAEGLWYAFWLMTDKMSDKTVGNGATDGAEIDIIEIVPHEKTYYTTIHWDGYGENLKSKGTGKAIGNDFYGVYHDLWFLWDENGYKLYMDGTDSTHLIYNMSGTQYGEGTCQVPCYLKITAEFGLWAGADKLDETQLPAHFYVDYVRVYKEME